MGCLLRCSRTTNTTTGCSCLPTEHTSKQLQQQQQHHHQLPLVRSSAIFFVPSPLCVPARSPTSLSLTLTRSLARYSPPPPLPFLSSSSSSYPSLLRLLSPPLSSFASFRSLCSPAVHLGGFCPVQGDRVLVIDLREGSLSATLSDKPLSLSFSQTSDHQ